MILFDSTARRRSIMKCIVEFLVYFLQEILIILNDPNKSFNRSVDENFGFISPQIRTSVFKEFNHL